jgi:hypothetical protein
MKLILSPLESANEISIAASAFSETINLAPIPHFQVKTNHDVQIAFFSLAGLYRPTRTFLGNALPRQTSQINSNGELAQKQSLLIAPPSGRGARTQDHLESST